MTLPILPTTVVGSYSMPGWLERLKTEHLQGRISRQDLNEVHDTAIKAAIKDQELAGLDLITDGELRRDNIIDYFAERLPGTEIAHKSKKFYYDFYDSVVRSKIPTASLGLVDDFKFLAANTDRATKFCLTGPHSLVKRIRNEYYKSEEEFALDIARVMNRELRELVRAGAKYLQIDEPYFSGFPEEFATGVRAINALTDGVNAHIALHICYGNRYGRPSWAGDYKYLFPAIAEARVNQLSMEFAWRGDDDLSLFKQSPSKLEIGVGVIDVKSEAVESAEIVAERIRSAMKSVPAERMVVLPDCGLHHLRGSIAFAKLKAMVEGAHIVRKEIGAA